MSKSIKLTKDPIWSLLRKVTIPASIGSFAGASSLNDLVPLVYYAVIVLIGVGMMALGGYNISKGR